MSEGYNGWENWSTWNVALWIGNDEGLYDMAKGCRDYEQFKGYVFSLAECGCGEIAYRTPDGAQWNDPCLDTDALDEMIEEL